MWQRFTERARRAVFFAQEEAGRLGENYVGTEHLLLGLVREDHSIAAGILGRMGISLSRIRSEMERQVTRGAGQVGQDMQLTPRAKYAIDLAYDEARQLNSNYIGTEHLLLGLIREGEGVAARVLAGLGADLQDARRAGLQLQDASKGKSDTMAVSAENRTAELVEIDTSMKGRDLLSIRDLSVDEVWQVFRTARALKAMSLEEQVRNPVLPGKTLAMIFEKPSLRTRVTFEAGMTQLGGHAIYLAPQDIQMGKRESVPDVGGNLSRWVNGIMARVFAHQTVTDLAKYASVPVINGLSDLEHPCQALADMLTIYEKKDNLKGVKIAYIGDGCNTCHSLMLLAAKVGADIMVGCPEGYEPDSAVLISAQRNAKETGSTVSVVNDPFKAVEGANAIYTDVWTSMGMEAEAEQRRRVFLPFQVNQKLVDVAADDVIILHCLPAHRGEEITGEVIDGPRSVVLDEAENRLHVQKAVMALVM